jgi:phenylacetate-CoA ligase
MNAMYESLFRNVLFPAYETLVKRRTLVADLEQLEKQQWLPPVQLRALQLARLNALLAHSWSQVPFLRSWWGDHGLRPEALRDVAELEAYPVLNKRLILDNFEGMTAPGEREHALEKKTSGSTAEPFRLRYSVASYSARNARMWRGYRWAGTDLGRRTLYLWGVTPGRSQRAVWRDRAFNAAYNRQVLDSFHLGRDNVADYVARINAYRPRTIVAYVAPLVAVAQAIRDQGLTVWRPENIITGAEALEESQRAVIEAAFGAPASNTYGSREFGLIAAECTARTGLHVNIDELVVETVDDENRPVQGRPGNLLITDLTNFAMPFVRYQSGDVATCTAATCTCGRGLPLLSALHGRKLDLIRTRDGKWMPGEMFSHLLMDFSFIERFQVVQHDLDTLEIKIVPRASWQPQDQALVVKTMSDMLGPQIAISVNLVDALALTATGKRRVTISHVAPLLVGAAE